MASSGRDSYETPSALFRSLHSNYRFTVDLAATRENAKVGTYLTGPCEGRITCDCGLCAFLSGHRVFCNPPYSNLKPWIRRFQELSQRNPVVVAVLPADPTTEWWRMLTQTDNVTPDIIAFTRKRVNFSHARECDCVSCKTGARPANTKGTAIAIWEESVWAYHRRRTQETIVTIWGWDFDGS